MKAAKCNGLLVHGHAHVVDARHVVRVAKRALEREAALLQDGPRGDVLLELAHVAQPEARAQLVRAVVEQASAYEQSWLHLMLDNRNKDDLPALSAAVESVDGDLALVRSSLASLLRQQDAQLQLLLRGRARRGRRHRPR